MIKISVLLVSVVTMFCFMIPGYLLIKTKVADDAFAKGISACAMYVLQAALLIHGFILDFDINVFKGVAWVFLLSLVTHLIFYTLSLILFKKAPERLRKVLRFGSIFSNAGYMGIPVISDVFGSEYAIYATVYIVWFNVFTFTLGRLIYTEDKRYVSLKKAIFNPAVISILIGLTIYLTGAGGWIQAHLSAEHTDILSQATQVLYSVLTALKNMVAPATMMLIGARLVGLDLKGLVLDKYAYQFVFVRHFMFPTIIWALMKTLSLAGIPVSPTVMAIVLILASTPAATNTVMFAEMYDGDSAYAGKLVALSTLLSVVTMPIMALLLYI